MNSDRPTHLSVLGAVSALLVMLSIVCGAASSHMVSAEYREQFSIAVHYHQYVSILMLLVILFRHLKKIGRALFLLTWFCYLFGIILFSGGIYVQVFSPAELVRMLPPLGGTLLISASVLFGLGLLVGDRSGREEPNRT